MRPTSSTTCQTSRGLIPLITARTSAPTAPTPAPSVGVQKPSQIAAQHADDQHDHEPSVLAEDRADSLLTSRRTGVARGARAVPAGAARPASRFADQLRLELGGDHDIGDHAARGEQARDDAGEEHLADRHFGQHAPDDHQHRRRDQHAEAGAAGDAAERELAS